MEQGMSPHTRPQGVARGVPAPGAHRPAAPVRPDAAMPIEEMASWEQEMATLDFSESSARNGLIRSGPSEQFKPTESGFTCFTAFQYASMVCAEIIVSPPRPTAAEIEIGRTILSASNTS